MPTNNSSEDDWEFEEVVPDQWRCEDCGHEFTKKWPPKGVEAKPCKCPKCKSYSAAPVGR